MPRSISGDFLAAIQAGELLPAFFVQIQFVSETLCLWTRIGTINWNGQTWQGVGSMLGISQIEEGANVQARGIVITLSGLDPIELPEVLSDFKLGLPVAVYFGLFEASAPTTLIASPVFAWAGRTDQPTVEVDGTTATISINCENRLVDMNVAVDRRYTNEDQQRDYPGDLAFQFVDALQEQTLYWGRTPTSSNNL